MKRPQASVSWTMWAVIMFALVAPHMAQAEHRFFDPRALGLPIDRCIESGATRCSRESQQRIADFFCSQQGYSMGAQEFTTKFVGPIPRNVAVYRELVPPPKFVDPPNDFGGLDVFNYIVCRTPFGSPRLTTISTPKGRDRIDRCINNHPDFDLFSRCNRAAQKIVADAYCRIFGGGGEAVSWGVEGDVGIHSIYDAASGGFGSIPGTDALKDLTCKRPTVQLQPLIPNLIPPGSFPR